jgi:hypothetical protein
MIVIDYTSDFSEELDAKLSRDLVVDAMDDI